jgi:hypothetical protein
MSQIRLSKQGGAWVLDGTGTRASLTTGFSMRRGTVVAEDRAWAIESNNPWRSGVTLSDSSAPVLRLDPDGSWVPGDSGRLPARWETGRARRGYGGTLTTDRGTLEVWLPRRGSAPEISVTGSLPHLDLLALSAAFAMLTQRRRDAFRAATIASGVSHH